MHIRVGLLSTVSILFAVSAFAQSTTGDVSVTADYLPNRHHTAELRARVFAETVIDPTPKLLFTLSGFAEGLLARRGVDLFPTPRRTHVEDAIVRVQDATVELKGDRFAVLAGFGRVVWGRLDEIQPTDVVNPLDVSRFFFEGRSQARLPVGLVQARAFFSEKASLEAVYVPVFRRGRFDQLDEPTSPFSLATGFPRSSPDVVCLAIGCPTILPTVVERHEPSTSFGNAQGGARFNATTGRVDWSVSAYRGFESFGLGRFAPIAPAAAVAPVQIVELVNPRFTMIGGDFETVRGQWSVRGEVAVFVDDNFQSPKVAIVEGSSFDAGVGFDRRAGSYRLSGTVLLHRDSYDSPIENDKGPETGRTDVSLIMSGDRSFARERCQTRMFGVVNPSEGSAFVRGISAAKLRDNLALEASGGWFIGDGRDTIGRFADSDFAYLRMKYFF